MFAVRYLIVLALVSCQTVVEEVVAPEDLSDVAESYCLANPTWPCGKVYACQTPVENPIGLIELCIPQTLDGIGGVSDADVAIVEAEFGPCELSPDERFEKAGSWLCWHCCGPGCGPGCNAYSGCYCPAPPEPEPEPTPDAGVWDMPDKHP